LKYLSGKFVKCQHYQVNRHYLRRKLVKSREVLIINVNLDWRMLVILGVIGVVLAYGYSAAIAQDGDPPVTNEEEVEPLGDASEAEPVTVPDSPEAQTGDLVYTTNGEWVPRDSVGPPPSSVSPSDIWAQSGSGSRFYLTGTEYPANEALTACASGYHMASLWEILDVSNLVYGHPAAHVRADSGQGPPSDAYGWVRTGYIASTSDTAGTGNCSNWTSTSNADRGTSIGLSRYWVTAPGDIGPWDATFAACDSVEQRVWCVGD
jgi:hypothetical protein